MNEPLDDGSEIKAWILNWLERHLSPESGEIRSDENLLAYGMDSVTAIMLVGDLESQFALRLPPTLLWDHPTVNALVIKLESLTRESTLSIKSPIGGDGQVVEKSDASIDPEEATRLLENIDELSDDQVDELLKRLAK